MVNSKAVGGIAAVVAVAIALSVVFATSDMTDTSTNPPTDSGEVMIEDDVELTKAESPEDPNNNQDFVIDDGGTKRYTISASDAPILED